MLGLVTAPHGVRSSSSRRSSFVVVGWSNVTNSLTILGLDPGFASCGYAEVTYHRRHGLQPIRMGVIRTVKAKSRATLKTQDDSRRARELSRILGSLIADADIVCAESLSIPFVPGKGGNGKVAAVKAAVQTATCWGVIVAHCQREKKTLHENTPQVREEESDGEGERFKGRSTRRDGHTLWGHLA